MKRMMILLVLGIAVHFAVYSQSIPTYPIPSWNVTINGQAKFEPSTFSQNSGTNVKSKKFINVTVHGCSGSHAHIVIYSLDGQSSLGPYTVYAEETLTVEIDNRDWGVAVQSEYEISVDVWYSFGSKKAQVLQPTD